MSRRDEEENGQLQEMLEISRIADYPSQLNVLKVKQVSAVESAVAKDRAIIAKYSGPLI